MVCVWSALLRKVDLATGTPPLRYSWFSFTLVGSRAVWYCYGDVYCFDIDKKVSDCVSDAGELVSPQEIDMCME